MQLYRTVNSDHIREIFDIEYKIKTYDDKTKCKCKSKDRSYGRIIGYLSIDLKKYNI